MDTSLLSDVVVYSVQVACVVAIGGALASIVRIDAADVRYFYWRALLALCLALPWIQVRQTHRLADGRRDASSGSARIRQRIDCGRGHNDAGRRQWTGSRSLAGF